MIGLVPFQEEEETPELSLSTMRGYSEKVAICKTEKGLSPRTNFASTLIFPDSRI